MLLRDHGPFLDERESPGFICAHGVDNVLDHAGFLIEGLFNQKRIVGDLKGSRGACGRWRLRLGAGTRNSPAQRERDRPSNSDDSPPASSGEAGGLSGRPEVNLQQLSMIMVDLRFVKSYFDISKSGIKEIK